MAAASGAMLAPRLARASAQGANDRIRVGVIGTGGRARGLMNQLRKIEGVELAAVCDVYEPSRLQAAKIAGDRATQAGDYRRLLDDVTLDAVLIGAPDHWHARMTIDAVGAGKDVYVEKPISHSIDDGVQMVKAVEASKQVVQTGTQQRSWEHWIQARQLIQDGALGQITFVHMYWHQHPRVGTYPDVQLSQLDWKSWLGEAPNRPFEPARFFQWRHFWDYGGGGITDLMTHWIDVVHWYMDVEAPMTALATGRNDAIKIWETPDTTSVTIEFPKPFLATYVGTFVSRVDDGGLEFRGDRGTLKINRQHFAFYRDEARFASGTLTPEPETLVRSSGDGTAAHLRNWVDCMRSRQTPNAGIRVGHIAARTSHIANASLKAKRQVRWDARNERLLT
jgi:predicted dehydrogenase